MQEPFDITLTGIIYAVFPEEEGIYAIYKEGMEFGRVQKDEEGKWLKLHPETELPLFEEDEEVNQIGRQIELYESEE